MIRAKLGLGFEKLEPRDVPSVTLFDTSTPPSVSFATGDTASVELGTKFTVQKAGTINEIRFYRAAGSFDNMTVHLWNSTGTLIGAGIAPVDETQGWKHIPINTVNVVPGETYVASYIATSGGYAYTAAGFDTPLNGILVDAPVAAGVFSYTGGIPNQSFQNLNYWVTPVYTPSVPTYSLFGSSITNSVATFDTRAVEVGTKFTVDVAGYVDAIQLLPGRFSQTVTVHLWKGDGTLLATTTVYAGGESGLRIAPINPVLLEPGTTYIVSYFSPNGNYSYTYNKFSRPVNVGPLHTKVGAGVYVYTDTGAMPTQTFKNSSYWITPVFTPIV